MRRVLIIAAVLCAVTAAPAAADSCWASKIPAAYNAIYAVGSWRALHDFYKTYGMCDQDSIAVGISDRVADLLTNSWNTLDSLKVYTDASSDFEEMVMYHIDPLMRADQAKTILDNARNHCPADATALCQRIVREVVGVLPKIPGAEDAASAQ